MLHLDGEDAVGDISSGRSDLNEVGKVEGRGRRGERVLVDAVGGDVLVESGSGELRVRSWISETNQSDGAVLQRT